MFSRRICKSVVSIFIRFKVSFFKLEIQFWHGNETKSSLFDLHLGHMSCIKETSLQERHFMHVCSFLQDRLRSFASMSKIRSASFQSFSPIDKLGKE